MSALLALHGRMAVFAVIMVWMHVLVSARGTGHAWCSSLDASTCVGKPLRLSKLPAYFGPFPMGYASPTALDWYGNGTKGLLVGVTNRSTGSRLLYFEREDNGSFVERTGLQNPFAGIRPPTRDLIRLTTADWNSDGKLDLLLTTIYGVRLFLQNEDGEPEESFSEFLASWTVGRRICWFNMPVPVDWNGDGQLDVLFGDCSGQIQYFEGVDGSFVQRTGSGNPFSAISIGTSAVVYPHAVDLDNDGDLDLVVNSVRSMQLSFFRRTADGGLIEIQGDANPFADVRGRFPSSFDIDGDGNLEIVVNADEGVRFYRHTADEQTLVERSRYLNPISSPQRREVHLLGLRVSTNGTLHLLAKRNRRLTVFEGSMDTPFKELAGASNPYGYVYIRDATAMFAVDWDQDGHTDLITGGQKSHRRLRFFRGSPSGKFQEVLDDPLAGIGKVQDGYPVAADWNRDGHLDLLLGQGQGNIRYFERTGNGSLVEHRGSRNPFHMIHATEPSLGIIVCFHFITHPANYCKHDFT